MKQTSNPQKTPATTIQLADDLRDRLLSVHQSDLYRYIVALTADVQVARDLLQNTNCAILGKWETYDEKAPFLPWAFGFARTEVKRWRRFQSLDRLVYTDEVFDQIASRASEDFTKSTIPTEVLEALEHCLSKLPAKSRSLVEKRYKEGLRVSALAELTGKKENAVSQNLFRLRRGLQECIERKLNTIKTPK